MKRTHIHAMSGLDGEERRLHPRNGQELTEYIIIVALVAVGTMLLVGLFGKQVKGVFTGTSGSLAGVGNAQIDHGFDEAKANVLRSGMDTYDEYAGGEGAGPGGPAPGGAPPSGGSEPGPGPGCRRR